VCEYENNEIVKYERHTLIFGPNGYGSQSYCGPHASGMCCRQCEQSM
jgi:hypothetical protein